MPDPVQTEKELKEVHQALKDLRDLTEGKGKDTAEVKGKVEKLEKFLDDQETKNQKYASDLAAEKKAREELKEQLTDMEKKLSRGSHGSNANPEAEAEKKTFELFVRKGVGGIPEVERKYLRTDSDIEGGYLAPPEYINEILKKITETSPIRSYARVRKTTKGEIEIPRRTSKPTAAFRAEGGTIAGSNSNYGMVKIPAHHLDAYTDVTLTMLSDAAFNMESEINTDIIEAFTEVEGQKFITGSLNTEPEGIMQNADVQVINSGIANDITADNLIDMQGQLKVGYNGAFILNRRTLARIRKLKDGVGQYLFAPAYQGMPNTILGDSYAIMAHMDDISSATSPVAYGDWSRGYTIVDGINLAIVRDPYTLATTGKVRFVFSRRVGGKVVMAEAIKKLTCSTASWVQQ